MKRGLDSTPLLPVWLGGCASQSVSGQEPCLFSHRKRLFCQVRREHEQCGGRVHFAFRGRGADELIVSWHSRRINYHPKRYGNLMPQSEGTTRTVLIELGWRCSTIFSMTMTQKKWHGEHEGNWLMYFGVVFWCSDVLSYGSPLFSFVMTSCSL